MRGGRELDGARGALLGTFVGDALGMPFEGGLRVPPHGPLEMLDARLGRGTYTDDTQMMIALAESLLAHGGVDEDALGRAFLAAYDSRRGYGSGTRSVLTLLSEGVPVAEAAERAREGGGGAPGNGAAMRQAPVAVRYAGDSVSLLDAATRTARVTHAHAVSIDAARTQAAAIAGALRDEDALAAARAVAAAEELRRGLAEAARLLVEDRPSPRTVATVLGNGSAAHQSVPTAIFAAVAHDDFQEAVAFAVRCGGDTDTIAAMTGAIAGARSGAGMIPAGWLNALENSDKGRSHVERLAERLVFYSD